MVALDEASPSRSLRTQRRSAMGAWAGRVAIGHFGETAASGAEQDVAGMPGVGRDHIAGKEIDRPMALGARLGLHP